MVSTNDKALELIIARSGIDNALDVIDIETGRMKDNMEAGALAVIGTGLAAVPIIHSLRTDTSVKTEISVSPPIRVSEQYIGSIYCAMFACAVFGLAFKSRSKANEKKEIIDERYEALMAEHGKFIPPEFAHG